MSVLEWLAHTIRPEVAHEVVRSAQYLAHIKMPIKIRDLGDGYNLQLQAKLQQQNFVPKRAKKLLDRTKPRIQYTVQPMYTIPFSNSQLRLV